MQAVALDPLTAAVLTLKEIREMTARDAGGASAQWLPQFAGKKLRPVPTISIPKDVKRAGGARSTRPWPSPTGSASWPRPKRRGPLRV